MKTSNQFLLLLMLALSAQADEKKPETTNQKISMKLFIMVRALLQKEYKRFLKSIIK